MSKWFQWVSSYAVGLVFGGLFFGGLTYASSGVRTIPASFANIKINVNGKTIPTAAEPFIFNHNVYVPVSTIGHGLGARVGWNGRSHEVVITDPNVPVIKTGRLNYYNLPVYNGTHTVLYGGKTYIAGFALSAITNLPYEIDQSTNTVYFGKGPSAGIPLRAFFDVRDYGDYAKNTQGAVGPDYGWSDGAPKIDGVVYPNQNSIVWATSSSASQVPGVTYNLNANYHSITGSFGMDDAADGKEKVQLTILGDGKQLYQSPWMAAGTTATPVSVDVTDVQLLTVSYAVQTDNGTVYNMGQTLPSGLHVDIDFADVQVH